MKVAQAASGLRRRPRSGDARENYRRQHPNDGDRHQKIDQ